MGSFLDPMADKVLIATLFVSLTWQNLIPLYLTLLIVARDIALVAAGFVIRYMSLPPPVRQFQSSFIIFHTLPYFLKLPICFQCASLKALGESVYLYL